jgi:hypothetical protein
MSDKSSCYSMMSVCKGRYPMMDLKSMVVLHGRKGQTYIASVTSDGLSEVARLGGESRGGCCEEREEGCDELHDGFEIVVLI